MMKKIATIGLALVIVSLVFQTATANKFIMNSNEIPFTLPENGGGMAHCDQKMSDCINMPMP